MKKKEEKVQVKKWTEKLLNYTELPNATAKCWIIWMMQYLIFFKKCVCFVLFFLTEYGDDKRDEVLTSGVISFCSNASLEVAPKWAAICSTLYSNQN